MIARQRREIETMIRHTPDGVLLANMRGEVVLINEPARQFLGVEGRSGLELAKDRPFREKLQGILEDHTRSDAFEVRVRKAGGEVTRFVRPTVSVFPSSDTGEMSVLVVLRDVTGEKRIDEVKDEFFQAVAHDLRAPLFAVQGYLRLLEKSILPDSRQKGYFDAISQSCEKLTLFIQDTLDAARIESGQLKLNVAPIDPKVLLRRAVALFRPVADEKAIRLDLKMADDAPAEIQVDERLMERVFYNLLSNALKFTPRDGAITLDFAQAGEHQVQMTVADTGPGIPEALKTQIFDKFRQLDSGQAKSGFGMGLNICHKIVKLHRGTIWVDSKPGQGSQFILRIPIKQ